MIKREYMKAGQKINSEFSRQIAGGKLGKEKGTQFIFISKTLFQLPIADL